jgi:hypothetical protein
MRAYRLNSPLQADFDKYYNDNGLRLAEVPHSRNFGFEQELSCGILANRCYAYVPNCLAGISFGTRIEIFN